MKFRPDFISSHPPLAYDRNAADLACQRRRGKQTAVQAAKAEKCQHQ